MGIQDRDYWQERYHKLIGYKPKNRRVVVRRSLRRVRWRLLVPLLLGGFVLSGLASMLWRFFGPR